MRLYRLIEWRVWARLEQACAFVPDDPDQRPFVILRLGEDVELLDDDARPSVH